MYELLLLVMATTALLALSFAVIEQYTPRRITREWHHAYVGLVACALGVYFGIFALALVGALVLLDDAGQHALQAAGVRSWRRDFSPLHRLYALPIFRPIHVWFDRTFPGR